MPAERITDVGYFHNSLKKARPGESMVLSVLRDLRHRQPMRVWLESIEGTNNKLGVQVQDVLLQESAGEVGG
jgi:hypothetical protein